MSHRSTLTFLVALATALMPAGAHGALAPAENGIYHPQNGAELLEAVKLVTDTPDHSVQGIIELASKTYVIDKPIVLADHTGDTIRGVPDGDTVITSTNATTLLDFTGENQRVDDITFRSPATGAAYPLVILGGRAQFNSDVDVVAGSPNVTAILTRPRGDNDGANQITRLVTSEATNAPAVRSTGDLRIDGVVAGGNPTVELDPATNALGEEAWIYGDLVGGPDTETVLDVRARNKRLTLITYNSTITTTKPDGAAIRLRGATTPTGSIDAHLFSSTIDAAGGTGIAIEPGAETDPTTVDADALLAIGADTTIGCAAPTAAPIAKVNVNAIYREGANAPTAGCTITEQGRVTGDPKFTDRDGGDLTPLWGSVLIDRAPIMSWHGFQLTTWTKPAASLTSGALPVDIGAAEYEYTQPEIDDAWADALDNRGLVRLSADGYDPDPTDQDSLTYEWTMPDGTKLQGQSVVYRWATEPTATPWVSVKVSDRTGQWIYEDVLPHPLVQPNKPYVAYHPDAYLYPYAGQTPLGQPGTSGGPRPSPTPGPLPRQTVLPKPAKPALPSITGFTLKNSRISRKGKQRQSGIGASRKGEAGAAITLTAAGKVNLTVARVKGKKKKPITVRGLSLPAGATTLHFSARFGNLVLPPGLYEITAAIGTRSVSRPLRLRVRR